MYFTVCINPGYVHWTRFLFICPLVVSDVTHPCPCHMSIVLTLFSWANENPSSNFFIWTSEFWIITLNTLQGHLLIWIEINTKQEAVIDDGPLKVHSLLPSSASSLWAWAQRISGQRRIQETHWQWCGRKVQNVVVRWMRLWRFYDNTR